MTSMTGRPTKDKNRKKEKDKSLKKYVIGREEAKRKGFEKITSEGIEKMR